MQRLHAYLAEETRRLFPEFLDFPEGTETNVPVERLTALHPVLRSSAIAELTHRITEHQVNFDQIAAIEGLLHDEPGSLIQVNDNWSVFRERGVLAFRKNAESPALSVDVEPNREYRGSAFSFLAREMESSHLRWESGGNVEYVDATLLEGKRLRLRTWRPGDEFVPLGMKHAKKISDFFVDEKVPLFEKQYFPVLETDDGDIVWVCGKRIDDRFRVTATTRRVLRLEFRRTATRTHG